MWKGVRGFKKVGKVLKGCKEVCISLKRHGWRERKMELRKKGR